MLAFVVLAFLGSTYAQLPGGWTNQNPSDKEYMDSAWNLAAPAINKHESNKGDVALVPVKILSAKTQVVAGTNTDLEIQVAPSSCPKSTTTLTAKACPANANTPTQVYVVRIFDQPWTKTHEVTSVTKSA